MDTSSEPALRTRTVLYDSVFLAVVVVLSCLPCPVLATDWNVTGMLRLTYGDQSLSGDVVKPNTEATPDGVRTLLFDDCINVYPYRDDLIVYHLRTGAVLRLTSQETARRYLADASGSARAPCPPCTDGDGAPIF